MLLILQPSLSSTHNLDSVCSCSFGSQPPLRLSFLHFETDLNLHVATSGLPSPAIVAVSRHGRGSYQREIESECEHLNPLKNLLLDGLRGDEKHADCLPK